MRTRKISFESRRRGTHEGYRGTIGYLYIPYPARVGAAANNQNNNQTGAAKGVAAPVVEPDLEGDKGVRGFWKHGRECIFDICLSNTERRSQRNKDPLKCLKSQEKEKKNKYEAACHEQCKDFSPLVYSINGMTGRATRAEEKRLTSRLAWKWEWEYSEMGGYVRCRMAIDVVRSNTLMWRGSQVRSRAHHGLLTTGAPWTHGTPGESNRARATSQCSVEPFNDAETTLNLLTHTPID